MEVIWGREKSVFAMREKCLNDELQWKILEKNYVWRRPSLCKKKKNQSLKIGRKQSRSIRSEYLGF